MNSACVWLLEQHTDEQPGAGAPDPTPHAPESGHSTAGNTVSTACSLAVFWLFALIDLSASMWTLGNWDVTSSGKGDGLQKEWEDDNRIRVLELGGTSGDHLRFQF